MGEIENMQNFFGWPTGATPDQKIKAVKKKAQKIEKLEKKPNKTDQDKRDIDFFETLGMPQSVTSSSNRKAEQDKESDGALMNTLKKMGVI